MKKITVLFLFAWFTFIQTSFSQPTIEWQKTIGGSADDLIVTIKQTNDGGYIISGYSESDSSGDKSENTLGFRDFWIIKLDNNGAIEWQNTLGGNAVEEIAFITATSDGGFIVSGSSDSDSSR